MSGGGGLSGDIKDGKNCAGKTSSQTVRREHRDGTKRKSGADYSGGAE